MNLNQLLAKLDTAVMNSGDALARRTLQDEANNLRARAQRVSKREQLQDALAEIDGESRQAEAQRAAIRKEITGYDNADLGPAMKEAARVLAMWS